MEAEVHTHGQVASLQQCQQKETNSHQSSKSDLLTGAYALMHSV